MKGFQQFQNVTGPKGNRPGGGAGGNNPFASNAGRGGGGGNNNRHRNRNNSRNRNKGKSKNPGETETTTTGTGNTTSITEANQPGLISTIATDKPLDFFSGQMAGQGQLTGAGPSVYENWQQNQFFNDIYSRFMNEKVNSPYDTSFDTYLTDTYGPGNAGLTAAAQRAFNLATPAQRGDFSNPFNNATGRTEFWG